MSLQENTTKLQALLDLVNSLPDAIDLTPIVEALVEKGATVGDNTVDGIVEAIAGIATGGGAKIATGTFTPAENLDSSCDITITHNLGEIPKFAMVVREPSGAMVSDIKTSKEVCFSIAINGEPKSIGYYYEDNKYNSRAVVACGISDNDVSLISNTTNYLTGSCIYQCTETTAKIYPIKNGTKTFVAGSTYRWILMSEEAYHALS